MPLSPTIFERVILSSLITVLAATAVVTQTQSSPTHALNASASGNLNLPLLKF
ncbi:MAG: hypothetical protein HC825_01550 [Oscillatoriales cyanobacterium RM1_1_9]|nr:hypothetical protein [Oscillatoriales cyanobacterium SM2_3_0]NJO45355.1 hypothetical protein [Oscillatoriales cyanobacterium RM2_1_1]NJO70742.1 hypothetical protein [Oscillatoriales cyanobacterium RM1_1_9]